MTSEQAKEQAIKNFKSGMNCAQAVSTVFAESLGVEKSFIQKIAQPFGGGMCRMREVCGCVSGMMLALGLYKGSDSDSKEAKDEVYAIGQKLAKEFEDANGSIVCGELLGIKKGSPVSEARTNEYYKKRPCGELCGMAAEIFQKYLDSVE